MTNGVHAIFITLVIERPCNPKFVQEEYANREVNLEESESEEEELDFRRTEFVSEVMSKDDMDRMEDKIHRTEDDMDRMDDVIHRTEDRSSPTSVEKASGRQRRQPCRISLFYCSYEGK